jgi:hypothetical protein
MYYQQENLFAKRFPVSGPFLVTPSYDPGYDRIVGGTAAKTERALLPDRQSERHWQRSKRLSLPSRLRLSIVSNKTRMAIHSLVPTGETKNT